MRSRLVDRVLFAIMMHEGDSKYIYCVIAYTVVCRDLLATKQEGVTYLFINIEFSVYFLLI